MADPFARDSTCQHVESTRYSEPPLELLLQLVQGTAGVTYSAQAVPARTMRRSRAARSRERASHHRIGSNLKRAGAAVNGNAWVKMPTGSRLVDGRSGEGGRGDAAGSLAPTYG